MAARKGTKKSAKKASTRIAPKTDKTVTPPAAAKGSYVLGGKAPKQHRGGRRGS